jgi:hypothetical protein
MLKLKELLESGGKGTDCLFSISLHVFSDISHMGVNWLRLIIMLLETFLAADFT